MSSQKDITKLDHSTASVDLDLRLLIYANGDIDTSIQKMVSAEFVHCIPDIIRTEKDTKADISIPRIYQLSHSKDQIHIFYVEKTQSPEIWKIAKDNADIPDIDTLDFKNFIVAVYFKHDRVSYPNNVLISFVLGRKEISSLTKIEVYDAKITKVHVDSAQRMLETNKWCGNCGETSRKLFLCGGCKRVYYCGKECQIESWKIHKNACRNQETRKVM